MNDDYVMSMKVKEITYKPCWYFSWQPDFIRRTELAGVLIEVRQPNVYKSRTGREYVLPPKVLCAELDSDAMYAGIERATEKGHELILVSQFFPCPLSQRDEYFNEFIYGCIRRLEDHEIFEWLKFGGEHYRNPHPGRS